MRIGGGLEAYFRRFSIVGWMWMDRMWPSPRPRMAQLRPPYGDYVRTSLKNVRNLWKMILFHDFPIRALKLAANHEKQVFTFFAFLPPYMGVSGSRMPCKRQILKRSIDWYQKFLISWHMALYWAVFVFNVRISQPGHRNSIEILSKFYRNSIEILSKF